MYTMTFPSTRWHTVQCPCCSTVRLGVKLIRVTYSICTPVCWNVPAVWTMHTAAVRSPHCRLFQEKPEELPIIETQAGDISAYIPTNVISITDGQIFLESELFNAGMRPAVNVGLSVSRVGGAAQTKAMKKASGQMRVDLAQFREMEVFTQFSSDLDPATQAMLDHGHVLMELLKQPLYHPLAMWKEVVILSAASNGLLDDVALSDLRSFREGLMNYVEANGAAIVTEMKETGKLSDESREKLLELVRTYKKQVN